MSDSRLIRSENFRGVTVDHIRALMQRLIAHYPRGWESTNGELLIGFFEERDITGPDRTVDVTPATRGSWAVGLHPGSPGLIKCWAGIEAYEQPGHTKVDFWDGYSPGSPPGVEYPPIGAAFEEFCEMIVREMQLLVPTREEAGNKHGPMDRFASEMGQIYGDKTIQVKEDRLEPRPPKAMGIFFAYAREDEDLRDELQKHLSILERQGVITSWHDRKIGAGKEWKGEIDTHLNTARVILLLISPDFIASDYCWDVEVKRAMERHEAGEARVIPVILRPVDWKSAPFGKLQALPKDAKPVTRWPDCDEALLNVAKGIQAAVMELRADDNGGELRQPAAR